MEDRDMGSNAMDDIREIVSLASRKAGYADLYLQAGASHSVLFEEGRMDTLSSSEADGLGARVVKGENTVYSHRTGTTAASAAEALREVSRGRPRASLRGGRKGRVA
jgi:predicted Zn-dependent protease